MAEQITINLEPDEARVMLRALLHGFDDMAVAAEAEGREISYHLLTHAAHLALALADGMDAHNSEQQSRGRRNA
jgi:hypothetical protein